MLISRVELASTMHEIEIEKDQIKSDPVKLSALFKEMIQMCLWYVSPPHQPGNLNIRPVASQGECHRPCFFDPCYDRGRY